MTRSIDDQTPERGQLSRRAVTTAAAWSLPVLAVAIAAPAAAASVGVLNVTVTAVCSTATFGPESRGFSVTVSGATLPTGSVFNIFAGTSILTGVGIVEPVGVVNLSNLNGLSGVLTTMVDIPAGGGFYVGLDSSLLDPAVAHVFSFQYGTTDGNNTDNFRLMTIGVSNGANVCS